MTIAEVRALVGPVPSDIYTTDKGKEGHWMYDPLSAESDNLGTVLVTADGKRIKRVYYDQASVKWFGATGDGITDDFLAIQNCLSNCDSVFFPEGNYVVLQTITRLLLKKKNIRGLKSKTNIIAKGNITAFDFDAIADNTSISNFGILVDETNAKDIITLRSNGDHTRNITIENITISTINGNFGLFTGIRFYTEQNWGIYRCDVRGVKIDNSKNGILLQTKSGTSSWITHVVIDDVYIGRFTNTGIGILEAIGTSVTYNTISKPRIHSDGIVDSLNVRTAIKIGGYSNLIASPTVFDDSSAGMCYSFDFSHDGAHQDRNFIIGGSAEGYIKGQENILNNFFDCTIVKRENVTPGFYLNDPIQTFKHNVNNILKKYSFIDGNSPWVGSGVTNSTGISSSEFYFSKHALIQKTSSGASLFYYDIPNKDKLAGKTVTFTAAVKSSAKCTVLIDEAASGFVRGTYHSGSGVIETLSVTKLILATGSVVRLAVLIDSDIPLNTLISVDWVNLSIGTSSPSFPVAPVIGINDIASGVAQIATNQLKVTVNHGLDRTPESKDFVLTPTNSLGNAGKWWLSNINSNTFDINVDVLPATTVATFAYRIF